MTYSDIFLHFYTFKDPERTTVHYSPYFVRVDKISPQSMTVMRNPFPSALLSASGTLTNFVLHLVVVILYRAGIFATFIKCPVTFIKEKYIVHSAVVEIATAIGQVLIS